MFWPFVCRYVSIQTLGVKLFGDAKFWVCVPVGYPIQLLWTPNFRGSRISMVAIFTNLLGFSWVLVMTHTAHCLPIPHHKEHEPFRCNPDVAPRLTSGGHEDKVDAITPISILFIGGGEF